MDTSYFACCPPVCRPRPNALRRPAHCAIPPSRAATIPPRSRTDRLQTSEDRDRANSRGVREPRAQVLPRPAPPPARPATATSPSRRLDRDAPPRSSPWRGRAAATPAASPNEMSPEMPFALPHQKIDAAVLRLAFVGIVCRDRLGAAIARRRKPAGGQACPDQIIHHRLGALFGQHLVEGILAIRVGVAGNFDSGGRAA